MCRTCASPACCLGRCRALMWSRVADLWSFHAPAPRLALCTYCTAEFCSTVYCITVHCSLACCNAACCSTAWGSVWYYRVLGQRGATQARRAWQSPLISYFEASLSSATTRVRMVWLAQAVLAWLAKRAYLFQLLFHCTCHNVVAYWRVSLTVSYTFGVVSL